MTFEEFKFYFWSYMDDNIVSTKDININNVDFCEAICFDCFRVYEQSNINIDTVCKIAENLIYNVYRFKPILGN